MANITRVRDDEYDTQRADARSGKRRGERPGDIRCQTVWCGSVRTMISNHHAQFFFAISCNTTREHPPSCRANVERRRKKEEEMNPSPQVAALWHHPKNQIIL